MWAFGRYVLPQVYWRGMLSGRLWPAGLGVPRAGPVSRVPGRRSGSTTAQGGARPGVAHSPEYPQGYRCYGGCAYPGG